MTSPDPRPGTGGEPLSAGPPYTQPAAPLPAAPAPPSAAPSAASGGAAGGAASRPSPSTAPRPARHAGKTIGRTLALALLVFVTVILVLFVVFNTQTVEISLVFTDVQAPLVVALLVAAGLGGLVVALASLLRRARRGR
ncbi:MAG: LapA family protein [Actinomycetota bacterium]|nr:LapA family protein [Actinomycetota bacterium]